MSGSQTPEPAWRVGPSRTRTLAPWERWHSRFLTQAPKSSLLGQKPVVGTWVPVKPGTWQQTPSTGEVCGAASGRLSVFVCRPQADSILREVELATSEPHPSSGPWPLPGGDHLLLALHLAPPRGQPPLTSPPPGPDSNAQPWTSDFLLPALAGNVLMADKWAASGSSLLSKGLCVPSPAQLILWCTGQPGREQRQKQAPGDCVMWTSWWLLPLVAVCTADRFREEAERIMRSTPVIDG